MERLDMHVPVEFPGPAPAGRAPGETLLEKMKEAGLSGGCLFSPSPRDAQGRFVPYEARMRALETWTKGCEGRLFPVCWLHPEEPDAIAHAEDAAKRGVFAFKLLCDSYYVYDDRCMELLRAVAALGKSVIFHSGILWYGGETSKYNRPLNWEALINVPGLKFSMGHCSWPWHDECIAMYGKFLNYQCEHKSGNPPEMFFDLTPGTPPIYRRDLLYKLFFIGYDVTKNIMFGTDSIAPDYHSEWAKGWIARDDGLYRELGIPENVQKRVYRDNLLRFLGVSKAPVSHALPAQDAESAQNWE